MNNGYIYIDDYVLPSLLAISSEEQRKGLMYEKFPPPIMTFVYPYSRINKFWMHNTPSPLDILFCNSGRITQICYGEPFSTAQIGDNSFSDLVIELPYGTAKDCQFKIGSKTGIVVPNPKKLKTIIANYNI